MASVCSSRSHPGPTLASDEYYNNTTTYNPKLDARHVDVPDNDESIMGQLVKFITSLIGGCFSPQHLIVVFRVLKAFTFCCLCAVIVSESIFLFLVEVRVSSDVLKQLGGTRDQVIRVYGIFLAFVAMFIELDMSIVDKYYYFMKAFLPRSCLLFFVTCLSGVNPIIGYEKSILGNLRSYDDDGGQYGGQYYGYGGNNYNANAEEETPASISSEVSGSAVAFQATTTFFLFICASAYFVMGIMCLDRFTSDAFLADEAGFSGTEQRANNFNREDSGRRSEASSPIDIGASFDIEYNLRK